MTTEKFARFHVGQLVRHRLFDYRGVVFNVDSQFSGDDEWYEQVARSRPPKNAPWYHVLPHGSQHTTYVAERNLDADSANVAIDHPLVDSLFTEFNGKAYVARELTN
ncbi:MAG: heat shock protein HspQ [Gammaproteobacteria bacterium]|jgi:heat shock protein HspQ